MHRHGQVSSCSLTQEIAEPSCSTGMNTSLARLQIAAINDSIERQWVWDTCALVLQSLIITSVAWEMAEALIVSATFVHVLNLVIGAIACPGGSWLTLLTVCAQPTEVSPERRLPSQTINNTSTRWWKRWVTEWDRSIQHGNGYLAAGVVLTFSAHVQQPPIPMYKASTQAIICCNKLNNYDVIDF